jgi:hypothetical protein
VINKFLPGGTVSSNFFSGGSAAKYPPGNMVSGAFDAQFSDPGGGDFRLKADSALRGAATDGGDIGADAGVIAAVMSAATPTTIAPAGTTGIGPDGFGGVPPTPPVPGNIRVLSVR